MDLGPENLRALGDVDNVVFPCGYTVRPDGDTLYLYYGRGGYLRGLATASIRNF